jgi:membrane protease YdiL (CAAX protease family)
MKDNKKSWLVILSIISGIFSFFSLISFRSSKEATLKAFESYDFSSFMPGMGDKLLSIYNNDLIYIFPSAFCLFLVILILFCCFKDYKKFRNLILGMFVFLFLSSSSFIGGLCAVAGLFICASVKVDKKEKKGIPSISVERLTKRTVIGSMICLFLYFSHFLIPLTNNVVRVLFYLLNFVVCFCFFKDEIVNGFKLVFKNFGAYFSFVLPKIGIMYLIYIISAVVVVIVLNLGVSANQQAVNDLPLYVSFPLAVIWAPIVEESLFRGCLRRLIKNDIVFIIVSGFIFGIIHTLGEDSLFKVFGLMVPYGVLGSCLAYLYVKTNNITTNMAWHSAHNFFTLVIQEILFGL